MVLFVNSVLTPLKACLKCEKRPCHTLVCIGQGCHLNVGKIVQQSILDTAKNNFSWNMPHPALITLMCIKGGVTFNEIEEKCPRASPLTLTGVLRTPAQGEEVKRAKKIQT